MFYVYIIETETQKKMKFTLESLQEKLNEQDMHPQGVINWALDQRQKYPARPHKPQNMPKTVEDAEMLVKQLKDYERLKDIYHQDLIAIEAFNAEIEEAVVAFMKDESGLLTIPKQYQDGVYSYAWNQGHAYGHAEVYSHLVELVKIF